MSGVKVQVDVRGFNNARRKLDRLSYLDTLDLLDNIGALVETQVRRRISYEKTDPDGRAWTPLDPDYAKWKRRHSSGGILEYEGYLLDSITFQVSGDELEVGSNVDYSRYHQLGEGVPERRFLGLSSDNEDEVETAIEDWLRTEVGR